MLSKLIGKFLKSKDQQAFNAIVKACQSELRGYCRRLTAGDLALADDIAQECLIVAYQQLGSLQNIQAFKSWLYRIAYRQYLSHLRTPYQQKVISEQQVDDIHKDSSQRGYEGCHDPHNATETEQLVAILMQDLTPEQRAVITLNSTIGYGHAEIAKILDMPLGTVKSHCKRGKDKMLSVSRQLQLGAA